MNITLLITLLDVFFIFALLSLWFFFNQMVAFERGRPERMKGHRQQAIYNIKQVQADIDNMQRDLHNVFGMRTIKKTWYARKLNSRKYPRDDDYFFEFDDYK